MQLIFVICFFYLFIYFQAFLGDLFQQHHKDVSADKLEEYTDTMVALDFHITGPVRISLVDSEQPLSLVGEALLDWLDRYGNSCTAWRMWSKKISFFLIVSCRSLNLFIPFFLHLYYARTMTQHLGAGFLCFTAAESLHLSPKLHFDRQ